MLAASYGCAASQTSCLGGVATHSGYELLLHQGMGPSPVSFVLYSPCAPTDTFSHDVHYPGEPCSAGPWYLPTNVVNRPEMLLGVQPHTILFVCVFCFNFSVCLSCTALPSGVWNQVRVITHLGLKAQVYEVEHCKKFYWQGTKLCALPETEFNTICCRHVLHIQAP